MMDLVRNGLGAANSKLEGGGDIAPKFLRGIEFNDLMNMERQIGIRQSIVNEPWVHLTRQELLVLFCKRLEHPIVPTSDDALCKS